MEKRIGKIIFNKRSAEGLIYLGQQRPDKTAFSKTAQKFGWLNPDYRQSLTGDMSKAVARPEEFLSFPFRHISATIVGGGTWKATEFTDAVLKKCAAKFTSNPVYVNHETEISNNVGVTGEAAYTKPFKAADGTLIPGGIDAPIWIDGILHTDLTRKLTAYPVPHIQSVSIGVIYEWEPSHAFTDGQGNVNDYAFEDRIGSMVDGKMVRRIVTDILQVDETSFVSMGADPFAKILIDGKPFHIEEWSVVGKSAFKDDPLSELYKKAKGTMFISENSDDLKKFIYLNQSAQKNNIILGKENNKEMKNLKLSGKREDYAKEILDGLEENFTLEFVPEKAIEDHADFKKVKSDLDKSKTELSTANSTIETQKTTLAEYGKIVKADELKAVGEELGFENILTLARESKTQLADTRKLAVKMYKAKTLAKASDAIVKQIEGSSGETLTAFLKEYGGDAYTAFGAKCKKCGSGELTLQSSVNPDEETKDEKSSEMSMSDHYRD